MNAVFRHLAVRLWVTLLIGGLLCLALLPSWQNTLGLASIYLPVVAVFALCFLCLGWMMNRIGLAMVQRQVSEAAVWERAGMSLEAENAFERAKAVYDGFWLSPLQRSRSAEWLSKRLARFYLAQATLGRKDHAMVLSYLGAHPEDEAVAVAWLEAAIGRERHSPQEQEIAARMGDALEANDQVQRLLMQLYLSDRRVDFEALQTYRRVWQQHGRLPDSIIRSLSGVLLSESIINDWALAVYLRGYALGDPHCLEGIAAGERLLSPNTDNRHDLAAAQEILSVLDEVQRRKLIRPFETKAPARELPSRTTKPVPTAKPAFADPEPADNEKFELGRWTEEELEEEPPAPLEPRKERVRMLVAVFWRSCKALGVHLRCYGSLSIRAIWRGAVWSCVALKPLAQEGMKKWHHSAALRRGAAYAALGAIALALIVIGWRSFSRESVPAEAPITTAIEATPTPVTDPFTIQVAAYLKPEDAQRFVEQLKQQQIDAFWNKATSANRTWYQVKVSHFATREDARSYGQLLKSKGVIDDFYVSNFSK